MIHGSIILADYVTYRGAAVRVLGAQFSVVSAYLANLSFGTYGGAVVWVLGAQLSGCWGYAVVCSFGIPGT